MARLTAVKVKAMRKPGRYGDGGGLYLVVGKDGRRAWVLRIQANGKRRDFGLGSVNAVSLAEARDAATDLKRMVREGRDPVVERRTAKERAATVEKFHTTARMPRPIAASMTRFFGLAICVPARPPQAAMMTIRLIVTDNESHRPVILRRVTDFCADVSLVSSIF